MSHRIVLTAVVLVSMPVLTGCSDPVAPLGPSGGGGEYCISTTERGAVLAFGAGYPTNGSDFDVKVTHVELTDARGMELIGTKAMYVPVGGPSDGIGAVRGWPPNLFGDTDLESRFSEAGEIENATIPPSTETKPQFVIGVRAEPGSRAGPLKVTYRAGADEWVWSGTITFRAGHGDC